MEGDEGGTRGRELLLSRWGASLVSRASADVARVAFGFAYVERLLEGDAAVAKRALDKIESLLPLLDRAGFARDMCVTSCVAQRYETDVEGDGTDTKTSTILSKLSSCPLHPNVQPRRPSSQRSTTPRRAIRSLCSSASSLLLTFAQTRTTLHRSCLDWRTIRGSSKVGYRRSRCSVDSTSR